MSSSFNTLNQNTSSTVPGYARFLGGSHANTTVTVDLTVTERKGECSRGEVFFDNSSNPVWASFANIAVLSNVLRGARTFLSARTGCTSFRADKNVHAPPSGAFRVLVRSISPVRL